MEGKLVVAGEAVKAFVLFGFCRLSDHQHFVGSSTRAQALKANEWRFAD